MSYTRSVQREARVWRAFWDGSNCLHHSGRNKDIFSLIVLVSSYRKRVVAIISLL